VAETPFLTTWCRSLGVLGLPLGQPGDVPRGLGGRAGVPICKKSAPRLWRTRCRVTLLCAFCQGRGRSCTTGRARKSIQCANATNQVHVSPVSADWKRGKLQPSVSLRKRTPGSIGQRLTYANQIVWAVMAIAGGGWRGDSQANHTACGGFSCSRCVSARTRSPVRPGARLSCSPFQRFRRPLP